MANRPSQIPVDVYCLRLTCGPALWCRRMVATHGKVDQCDTAPQAALSGAAFAQQNSVLKLRFSGKHQFSNNACIKDPSTTSVAHIPLPPAPTRPTDVAEKRHDHAQRSVEEIPPVPADQPSRPHLAEQGDRHRADLAELRPARRQPVADRADGSAEEDALLQDPGR